MSILIGDDKRRGVAYVSKPTRSGLTPIGTAFFVEVPISNIQWVTYAVTARHVVEGEKDLRLEFLDDGKDREVKTNRWFMCPDNDIAACRVNFDCPVEAVNVAQLSMLAWTEQLREEDAKLHCGTDVFTIGLFVKSPFRQDSHGTSHIEPIVRFGKISLAHTKADVCVDATDETDPEKHRIVDAILIECISFGGESGAPVFIAPSYTRDGKPGDEQKGLLTPRRIKHPPRQINVYDHEVPTPIIGMISSHWKIGAAGLNSGIAVVIPGEDIMSFLLNDPKLERDREKIPRRDKPQPTSPLSAKEKEPTFTKKDFETALKKVSRKLGREK